MEENYIVSARKYRPTTFKDVVGQQALTHTLKTAIDSGRLAHAYLFCGPRGVGKTSCARIFAKTINCTNLTADGEACNECESCTAFNEQRSYNIVELDAASNNSVDDIRNITKEVHIPPQLGKYRVFIIDEVHMLSPGAFNAFLKTLEEPPEYVIFILATTEKQKVIPTILSRCQIYDFNRITVKDIVKQLQRICEKEGIEAEPAALNVIAQKADGAMRDALSIFDQVTASTEGHITYQSTIDNLNVLDYDYYFRLDDAFLSCNVPQALLIYKEIRDNGFDSQFFINGLAQHLRDLMVASTPETSSLLEMNDEITAQYVQQATKMTPNLLYKALDYCNSCDLNYRNASNKQLLVELTLIKICQLVENPTPPKGDKKEPIKKIEVTAPVTQPAPAATTAPAKPQATAATQPAATPAPTPQEPAKPATTIAHDATEPSIGYHPIAKTTLTSARIHDLIKPEKGGETTVTGLHRENAFTPQQLLEAWQKYIDQHPQELIVINTMKESSPKKINDTTYEIFVENSGQVDFMNATMKKLITFLRDAVRNDMLAIEVKINPNSHTRKILSDREIVEDLKSRHPEFIQMLKDFDLGLA
jgi:DNA polymerase-3 subunit gamma/tau